ncbi:MAG: hypothetical protein KDD45_11515 [Bdellovibrionales bacterium]|nr:hypothetical protein [Bdellovibrionales bacterium]
MNQIYIQDSPNDFFFSSHIVRKTTDHLINTRGWITDTSLVFSNESTDIEKKLILSKISKLPIVKTIESHYAIEDYLTKDLDESDQKMTLSLWEDSSSARRFISKSGLIRSIVYLNSMEMDAIKDFKQQVDSFCFPNKCNIVGTIISYNEFSQKILNTLFSSLGLSIILVTFILLLIRNPLTLKEAYYVIISSVWGPFVLLSFFILFKIPIFFVSCICASVLIGLAGDNAIQFIFQSKHKKLNSSVDSMKKASLIVTIGMVCLTFVFTLSPIASLAKLGILIIIGFVLGYIGDIWILQSLLSNTSKIEDISDHSKKA